MTRISENQKGRSLIDAIAKNREKIDKFSNEVSSGYRVVNPGDSKQAATISLFRQTLERADGYRNRLANVQSSLAFQDDIMVQVNDLMIRAKEIATQGANETNGSETRAQMSAEVFQMRDHLIQLANSRYQGRYIYGGADDDDPPYDQIANFTTPSTGDAAVRYAFDAELGTSTTRTVQVTDDLSVTTNTVGSSLFDNALYGLERLGRALAGYATNPASGAPDGTGAAYTFPAQFTQQTTDIKASIALFDTARETDIMQERVDLGGRMRRLDTAAAILDLNKASTTDALAALQDADIAESATNLTQAQTALEASMTVSLRILNLSILDFL